MTVPCSEAIGRNEQHTANTKPYASGKLTVNVPCRGGLSMQFSRFDVLLLHVNAEGLCLELQNTTVVHIQTIARAAASAKKPEGQSLLKVLD